jgi:hypothetical protein
MCMYACAYVYAGILYVCISGLILEHIHRICINATYADTYMYMSSLDRCHFEIYINILNAHVQHLLCVLRVHTCINNFCICIHAHVHTQNVHINVQNVICMDAPQRQHSGCSKRI